MQIRFFSLTNSLALVCFSLLAVSASISCSSKVKKSGPSAAYQGLGRESMDEKTLAKFAPSALPSELTRKIQNSLDLRPPGLGMLSANQKELYFSWRVTGTSQVWKLDRPKGFPIQLTGGEDMTGVDDQTPDGKWLIISRDRNGEENPGLYLQSPTGGPLKVIQHKAKVQTIYQFTSSDSKFVYYRANDVKPDSYTFYRYNIASGEKELLFTSDGYWNATDFKDDGRILLNKALSNSINEIYEFNSVTKELKPLLGQNEKEEYNVQYGAKEGELLVLTPKIGEFRRLYVWNGKDLRPISPDIKADVEDFKIDRSRKFIAYSVNEQGYSKGHFLNAKTFKSESFPAFPGADQIFLGSMAKNGSSIILGVERSTGPRTSYSYNFHTKALTQWVVPSQPEIKTEDFARATLEYYKSRDAVQIPMFVRRPTQCGKAATAPCPVVVSFHGGPEGQSKPGFSPFAQLFVDEGIIFVEPNVRGSEGYGKTWLHSDDGPKRLDVVTDIEDAALFIKKNWAVNGKAPKVGVIGGSYGGYATLMAMTYFAGSYDAGVSNVGISNLETFLNNTAPYRRALRITEYGDPVKDKEALVKLSPIQYLDRVKNPLMIIQGATDPRVPVGEAVQIHQALEAKKIPSSLIVFADEGHGSAKRSNQVLERGHSLNFLKKNLQ
jgi:dipeptidyl aminopeptidase/acylaminoacyl peptidase